MMMSDVIRTAFDRTVATLEGEASTLSLWNESVLRYHFCRSVAAASTAVEQFVECGRIDLVLALVEERAFVEFKYYARPTRFDPYGSGARGFKGGPSSQNLREFQRCVDYLHSREARPSLRKYIVLVYVDPTGDARTTYETHYGTYQHPRTGVLALLHSAEIRGDDAMARAILFEVDSMPASNG